MKETVCQLFKFFQRRFANLSLPCEGRLTDAFKRKALCDNREVKHDVYGKRQK